MAHLRERPTLSNRSRNRPTLPNDRWRGDHFLVRNPWYDGTYLVARDSLGDWDIGEGYDPETGLRYSLLDAHGKRIGGSKGRWDPYRHGMTEKVAEGAVYRENHDHPTLPNRSRRATPVGEGFVRWTPLQRDGEWTVGYREGGAVVPAGQDKMARYQAHQLLGADVRFDIISGAAHAGYLADKLNAADANARVHGMPTFDNPRKTKGLRR